MTAKKEISQGKKSKNNGKKGHVEILQNDKMTVKYTFERSKEDIENLEKLRNYLKRVFWNKTWNTDSEIYRDLPDLYLNAVKKKEDLGLAIDELTAKLDELEDLRTSFRRIFKICEVDK